MWYVVDILFAQKPDGDQSAVMCESCNVLFEAPSAIDACGKATSWSKEHVQDSQFHLIGIQHLWSLDEDRPGDGTEIGGSFFEERDPWGRRDELIPDLNEIGTVKLEAHPDTPVGELVPVETIRKAKKIFGEE